MNRSKITRIYESGALLLLALALQAVPLTAAVASVNNPHLFDHVSPLVVGLGVAGLGGVSVFSGYLAGLSHRLYNGT